MTDSEIDKPGPGSRISTVQRDRIIDRLSVSYAHDLLDEQEFERRVTEAQSVTTHEALLSLVADLPEAREDSRDSQFEVNTGSVPDVENFTAILGGSERKGPWRPARHSRAVTVLGGVALDYRDAVLPPGVTEITVFCLLGGLEITVPPGMNVELSGTSILGGFENKAGSGEPGAPTLRVNGTVILGGVEVRVKDRKPRRGLSKKTRRGKDGRFPDR